MGTDYSNGIMQAGFTPADIQTDDINFVKSVVGLYSKTLTETSRLL